VEFLTSYPSPVHFMQIYSTVACLWYKVSTIWIIVVQSIMAYKLLFIQSVVILVLWLCMFTTGDHMPLCCAQQVIK